MWNMKVLSLVILKLWPRLKFLSTDDDNNNDDNDDTADAAGAMTIVLRTFVTGELKSMQMQKKKPTIGFFILESNLK